MKERIPVTGFSVLAILLPVVLVASACSSPVERLWAYPISSPIYSTPLLAGDFVIFGSEAGTLYAVDKMGQSRWQYQVPSGEIFSRPATDGKLVFFGSTNQKFYAVDMTGQLRWQFAARERIKSDPLIHEGVAYITSYDGHVYALQAARGNKLWQFPPLVQQPDSVPPAEDKNRRDVTNDAGKEKPAPPQALTPPPGAFSYSAPTVRDGVLYVGNLDGYLYAINTADGSLKWRFKAEEGITSSPLVDEGVVYFGSKDDNVYALDAASGQKVIWKYKTGGDVLSSPRLSDGLLYIGSNDKHLYALDAKTGKLKCRFAAKGPIVSYPVFYKNLVIFSGGQGDGRVYFVQQKTCQPFYAYRTGYKIESDPVLEGDRVYITSGDSKLYTFKIRKTQ